jgi:hypothetical protein
MIKLTWYRGLVDQAPVTTRAVAERSANRV